MKANVSAATAEELRLTPDRMHVTRALRVSFRKAPFPATGLPQAVLGSAPTPTAAAANEATKVDPLAPSPVFTPPAATWSVPVGPSCSSARRWVWPLYGLEHIPEVSEEQRRLAACLFGSGARYLGSQESMMSDTAPEPTWSEVVVLGRSNVGKSSLLNALLGSKDQSFVPVSRQPGKTKTLDWYGVGTGHSPYLVLVDTPGYGYSKGGKARHDAWMGSITHYLHNRPRTVLSRVMLLVDARLGLGEQDKEVLSQLEQSYTPLHVVATKADTVSAGVLEALALAVATALNKHIMPFPVLNAVSSKTGAGIQQLKETLVQTSKVSRKLPPHKRF